MSYYQTEPSYYKNENDLYGPGGDANMPVPGWGLLPHVAGPDRIAIGAAPIIGWGKGKGTATGPLAVCIKKGMTVQQCLSLSKDAAIPACVEAGRTMADCMSQAADPATQTCVSGGNTLAACMDVKTDKGGVPWWVYIAVPVGLGTVVAVGSWYAGRKKA